MKSNWKFKLVMVLIVLGFLGAHELQWFSKIIKAEDAIAKLSKASQTPKIVTRTVGVTAEERAILLSYKAGKEGTLSCLNNNPLNIKVDVNGRKWKGQVGVDKYKHIVFKNLHYGLRAGAITLLNYEKRHGIKTLEGVIKRFCGGNREYVMYLSRHLKLKPKEKFSIAERLEELLYYMSKFESGKFVNRDFIMAYEV